jgi:hypothetical protein
MKLICDDHSNVYYWIDDTEKRISPHFDYEQDAVQWKYNIDNNVFKDDQLKFDKEREMEMKNYSVTNEEYIAVLETEIETLRRYYFDPYTEGTGHYNTAIGVLQFRISQIKAEDEINRIKERKEEIK